MQRPISEILDHYFETTKAAIRALSDDRFAAHRFIILYSTIDTCGLLNATSNAVEATGETFEAWAKAYLIPHPGINFSEHDLWAARCAVLHTFTTASRLSRKGQARQLVFHRSAKGSVAEQGFVSFADAHEGGGKYIAVHIDDFFNAFDRALEKFRLDFAVSCARDAAYENRARDLVAVHKP